MMKVTKINKISDETRAFENGPGVKTQQDIVEIARPREDVAQITKTQSELPGLNQTLCGPDVNRETLSGFFHQVLRMRPGMQELILSMGTSKENPSWRKILTAKAIQKMNTQEIAEQVVNILEKTDNVGMVKISINDGVSIGTTSKKPQGEASITLSYHPIR
jgi:hypothetical protein